LVWNYFAGSGYCVLDLQSEEEVRCCLSGSKVSFDEKRSHGSAVCETVYFFVEFVCVFPWKCVSLNNQNRGKNHGRDIT
jgi:hypothetical protein